MYPVEARSGRRIEQATRTDVIPAAVPSMVFSGKFAQVSGLKEKAQTGRKDNTYCQFCSTWGHHTCDQPLMPKHKSKSIQVTCQNFNEQIRKKICR